MAQKELLDSLRQAIRKLEKAPLELESRQVIPLEQSHIREWLPWGGFPKGALTELRGEPGAGGSSFLSHTIAAESRKGWVAILDGSGCFYPLALQPFGVRWSQLCMIRLNESKRLSWVVQQMCKSGLFSLVVVWGGKLKLDARRARGLVQAAEAGRTAAVFVAMEHPLESVPCALRLNIRSRENGIRELNVLKGAGRIGQTRQVSLEVPWIRDRTSSALSSRLFACRPSNEKR